MTTPCLPLDRPEVPTSSPTETTPSQSPAPRSLRVTTGSRPGRVRRVLGAACVGLALATTPLQPASAAVPVTVPAPGGGDPVPLEGPRTATATDAELEALAASPGRWPERVVEGATQLQMTPAFIHTCQQGLELLYERRYRDMRGYFAQLSEVFPGTAVAPIADLLVWQAVMLENFDYRHDAAYQAASAQARAELTAAMETPGNDGWESFMMAGVSGIEAIHAARQGRYLPALSLAFEAIDHVQRVRTVSPDFADLALADGLYNYWRTVVTERSKALPDFGDKKQEGITQMQSVQQHGIFLRPPATLSMAFTWIEERDYDRALASCIKNQVRYPDNVINELMRGATLLYRRDYPESLAAFEHILEIDPKNRRARYYRGLAQYRSGKTEAALASFEDYLSSDYLEEHHRAAALYRKGRALDKLERWGEAEAAYKEAVKINGHDSAKASLDRLRKAKREGRVSY